MSRYHQSSNPFEDDDEDGDFVMVGKPGGGTSSQSKPAASSSSSNYAARSTPGQQYPQRQTGGNAYGNPSRQTSNAYSSHSSSSYGHGYDPDEDNPFEGRRQQLMRQIENSENTQLESTQRALASIYDSEAMGVATAEELVRQGETLDNIESKTENMQQNLKTSQRHLNNIKSVFGGIKNWWSGDKSKQAASKAAEDNANTRLRATIEKTEKTKPDVSGFYEDDNDLDSKFMAGARKPGSGQYTMIQPVTRSAREEEVDYNLGLMSDGMSRLKGLAQGLGDEIERQNEQLDRINYKVEATDDLLTHQNTQMRRILKK